MNEQAGEVHAGRKDARPSRREQNTASYRIHILVGTNITSCSLWAFYATLVGVDPTLLTDIDGDGINSWTACNQCMSLWRPSAQHRINLQISMGIHWHIEVMQHF